MSLLIVGSVAFDSIETPFGKIKKTLGGSASYFSLAACFFARPSVVGVVGNDFTDKYRVVLKRQNIDLTGLKQTAGQTFSWGGKYSFDLNNRATLFTKLGVFEKFRPKLSAKHKQSDYIFLGNVHPALQLEVLKQIRKPKLVGLDTMNLWIEKAPKELSKVLRLADIFVINDSEARELSGQHNLVRAAKKIIKIMAKGRGVPSAAEGTPLPPILIIKRGEYGLLMFRGNDIFHLPGFPLEDVIDPTGAGDSFAGGFMGYLCRERSRPFPTWDDLKRASIYGSVMASFCVERLGTQRLQEIKDADIKKRLAEFKKLTQFDVR